MKRYLGIIVIVLMIALLGVQTVPAWTPPTCGAGETLVEHVQYEDHFDNAASFDDWAGSESPVYPTDKKNNFAISIINSSLETFASNSPHFLIMNVSKFGPGNYSFRARTLDEITTHDIYVTHGFMGSAKVNELVGSNSNIWDPVGASSDFEFYSDQALAESDFTYLTDLRGWNWYNYTVYEDGGNTRYIMYINNTAIFDASNADTLRYNYIYVHRYLYSNSGLTQYDYISHSNWTCESAPAPIPDRFPGDHLSCSVNKTGDNFIWWWWSNSSMESAPNLTETVFLNGNVVVQNGSLGYYVATGLNPDEKQVLELWGFNQTLNTRNTTCICTDKTYEQDIWTLLYIGCALIVLGWFTAPILILLSCGVFLLGFGMAYDMTTQSYIILVYGIGFVFSMITFYLRWNY